MSLYFSLVNLLILCKKKTYLESSYECIFRTGFSCMIFQVKNMLLRIPKTTIYQQFTSTTTSQFDVYKKRLVVFSSFHEQFSFYTRIVLLLLLDLDILYH